VKFICTDTLSASRCLYSCRNRRSRIADDDGCLVYSISQLIANICSSDCIFVSLSKRSKINVKVKWYTDQMSPGGSEQSLTTERLPGL